MADHKTKCTSVQVITVVVCGREEFNNASLVILPGNFQSGFAVKLGGADIEGAMTSAYIKSHMYTLSKSIFTANKNMF